MDLAEPENGRYRRLLAIRDARNLLLVQLPARMPVGIIGLAIVLFVREHVGSYALAGLTAGAFGLCVGVGSPLIARAVDRLGIWQVLAPAAAIHVAAMVALIVTGLRGAPSWTLVVSAAVAGGALPPLGSVSRALWPRILAEGGEAPGLLSTALAAEGVVIDAVFAGGPLLAALLTALADSAFALAVAPLFLVCGLVLLAIQPPVRTWVISEHAHSHGALGALRSRGLRTLMWCVIPLGFCFGATEVTLPAFAEQEGSRVWGGILIAAWAVGSVAGGMAYGAVHWRGDIARRYALLTALLPFGYLPLALGSSLTVMALLALIAGLLIAPVMTTGNQVVGDVAPEGTETEAFTWPLTALLLGIAIGNAVAGAVVTHHRLSTAFLVATAGALVSTLIAATRWRTLRAPAAPAAHG